MSPKPGCLLLNLCCNVLPSQGHIDDNFSSAAKLLMKLLPQPGVLEPAQQLVLPPACLPQWCHYIAVHDHRESSFTEMVWVKKKVLLKLKPVLCPFVTYSMVQLVDNSSSKTEGTINLSARPGTNALGQKPLPIFAVR